MYVASREHNENYAAQEDRLIHVATDRVQV